MPCNSKNTGTKPTKTITVTYSFPVKAFNKEEAETIISQKLRGITLRRLVSVKEGK